jgi:hypothetical protein
MIETIDDIVGDIRAQNQGLPEDGYALSPLVCDLLRLADRIEAAHKREREATCKESLQVGNAAALRETLLRCDAIAQLPEIREYKIVKEMRNLIRGVLASPHVETEGEEES